MDIISLEPYFNKNTYLLSAIAHKKLGQYNNMLKIITECLNYFPKYYDAFVFRGKYYLRQN